MVVTPEDAAPAAEVGTREQAKKCGAGVYQRWKCVDVKAGWLLRRDADEPPQRRTVGEKADGKARHRLRAVDDGQVAVVGDVADDRRRQFPGLEDGSDLRLAAALHDDEHPLLRFGEHHVVRAHAALSARYSRDVDVRARAAHPSCALRHG